MMMKLSRQFTVFGSAIFCVVIFSLYLMLDHLQLDHTKSPNNGGDKLQNGQLSILQDKIDRLERLLSENNEIIANIRDSVINLKESVKDGRGGLDGGNMSQGHYLELLASPPLVLPIDSQDCQFATREFSKPADGVQLLDVYDLLTFDNHDGGVWKQGFDITYQDNEWDSEPLQVFVVPHSHNDPGWLKTFDDYYRDQTQHILNNIVVKLHEDSRRKMIWSEISYFSKWWDNIDNQKRDAVKSLFEQGQLEITTGGWVMPDEANSHYFALIDQLLEGHQWLERNVGVKPQTGWAVDPFGHSPTQAYLLKQAGLANMLIQRVHYSVKKHFASQETLEFFWRQNWDPASSTDILCHMMPFYSYDVPHTCGPDPKICCQFDFKRLPGGRVNCPWRVPPQPITDGNVQQRVQMLLDQYRKKSKLFRTKVVMVPLGDDFRYAEALEWDQQFQNYQKLFDYMNSHPELHVKAQFGTITDYFNALRKLSIEPGHPSASLPVVSGDFFTYADRDDHYWSGYFTSRPFYKRLDRVLESHLRAAEILYSLTLANIQRFGKLNDFPAVENNRLLTEARRNLGLFQHHDAIAGTGKDMVVIDYGTRCHSDMDTLINHELKGLSFSPRSVVVYNPTEQDRTSVVTVYVNTPHVCVITDHGHPVPAQVSAVWDDSTTASTERLKLKENGSEHQIKVEFAWYGTTSNRDKSGAYLFLPDGEAKMYSPARSPVIRVTKGSVFSEITTSFDHVTHTLRLYNVQGVEGQAVEICNLVDIRREFNHEIAMRLASDVDSKDRFFTDLNGFQIQPRRTMAKLPLQANFYPMTSMAYIQDPGTRLTLLTAQSLGSASLVSGQLEVIMDRRLNQDDNRGLGQGVLDNKVTPSTFRLLLEKRKPSPLSYPSLLSHVSSLYLNHPLISMAVSTEAQSLSLTAFTPLASSLPCDIHLVNLRSIQSKEDGGGPSDEAALILHRKGFDCAFSNRNTGLLCATTQGKIHTEKLFSELRFQSIIPVSLTLMHTTEGGSSKEEIRLKPMEISTYRVQLT
uniref:mannosyl-oligosaccharide 1,3-1,6-alpha-mannosidase n=1 Tax=Oncorhynchus tshawytscha TaxID=74940 RepID=A0A8C8MG15_ONCTS